MAKTDTSGVNLAPIVDFLRDVEQQNLAAKDVNKESASLARMFATMSNQLKVEEKRTILNEAGYTDGVLDELVKTMEEMSTTLNPQATALYDKDTVSKQLTALDNLLALGMIGDDVTTPEEIARIRENIKVKSGGGVREARQPLERIENRPLFVESYEGDVRFSKQVGNTKQSVSNVKNRAVTYLAKRLSPETETNAAIKLFTESHGDVVVGIEDAVKAVVEEGSTESSFGGITFRSVNAE
jgi:hypothetical protein